MGHRLLVLPLIAAVGMVAASTSAAQEPPRTFEVASVKPSVPPPPNRFGFPIAPEMRPVPGGFAATQATLRDLIRFAYELPDFRIIGGAEWMAVDRFDIVAKVESGASGDAATLRAMLRSLLADRFALRVHDDTRELPVFHLVVAREGRIGPRLRSSPADRTPARPSFKMNGGAMTIAFEGLTMDDVAQVLTSPQERRHVINRTGLTGRFDGDVTFAPEPLPGFPPPPPTSAVTLSAALPEQLGLRLEAGRGPVQVMVIDSAQRPTIN